MIRYTRGNIIECDAEALVNTVNTVGVMGKGIALMFRQAFPENYERYRAAAGRGEIRTGEMFVVETSQLVGPRWIINFPTKQHWKNPSRLEWIERGLAELRRVIKEYGIRSIAIPPLGCGNGGLHWEVVRSRIEAAMKGLTGVDVVVFEPTPKYQNKPKKTGLQELTPARTLIAGSVRRYEVLGFACSNLEVQKLAWFVERSLQSLELDNPLNLQFSAGKYGPYADRLRHLLNGLDGTYLQADKRVPDAGPSDTIQFNHDLADKVDAYLETEAASRYKPALDLTGRIIEGFESPLGMELLATVDWLLSRTNARPTLQSIRAGIDAWPGERAAGERKQRLFKDTFIRSALERLQSVHLVLSEGDARFSP